jgi:DNA-binding NarL/FixJ family response regulator
LPEPHRHLLSGNWRAAATAWKELHAPYEQALALADGDEPACNEALAILEQLGARPVAEKIREMMKQKGMAVARRGPRASTVANPCGLTRRQMDVLALLDEGLSNAQIADRLFVSPKTVDHHVSAILEKLEVSTRGQAAAFARSEGIL